MADIQAAEAKRTARMAGGLRRRMAAGSAALTCVALFACGGGGGGTSAPAYSIAWDHPSYTLTAINSPSMTANIIIGGGNPHGVTISFSPSYQSSQDFYVDEPESIYGVPQLVSQVSGTTPVIFTAATVCGGSGIGCSIGGALSPGTYTVTASIQESGATISASAYVLVQ